MFLWLDKKNDVNSHLAQIKPILHQESYEIYKSSLHWLADQDKLKSDILVAMGCLAYKVG